MHDDANKSKGPDILLSSAFLEPLDELTNHLLSIVSEIGQAEGRYVARVRDAVADLRKTAEERASELLQKEIEAQFNLALERIKEQFNTSLLEAKRALDAERITVELQMEELNHDHGSESLRAELERTNNALIAIEAEIARMIEDPDVELSKIIRNNTIHSELKAYLRGLRYQAEAKKAPAGDTTKEPK